MTNRKASKKKSSSMIQNIICFTPIIYPLLIALRLNNSGVSFLLSFFNQLTIIEKYASSNFLDILTQSRIAPINLFYYLISLFPFDDIAIAFLSISLSVILLIAIMFIFKKILVFLGVSDKQVLLALMALAITPVFISQALFLNSVLMGILLDNCVAIIS